MLYIVILALLSLHYTKARECYREQFCSDDAAENCAVWILNVTDSAIVVNQKCSFTRLTIIRCTTMGTSDHHIHCDLRADYCLHFLNGAEIVGCVILGGGIQIEGETAVARIHNVEVRKSKRTRNLLLSNLLSINMTNSVFRESLIPSIGAGGCVAVLNARNFISFQNVTISHCQSPADGGCLTIYLFQPKERYTPSLFMENITLSKCKAAGGLEAMGGGCLSIIENFLDIVMREITLDNCTQQNTAGGGMLITSLTEPAVRKIDIENVLCHDCYSMGNGGCLRIDSPRHVVTLTDLKIMTANSSAVVISSEQSVVLQNLHCMGSDGNCLTVQALSSEIRGITFWNGTGMYIEAKQKMHFAFLHFYSQRGRYFLISQRNFSAGVVTERNFSFSTWTVTPSTSSSMRLLGSLSHSHSVSYSPFQKQVPPPMRPKRLNQSSVKVTLQSATTVGFAGSLTLAATQQGLGDSSASFSTGILLVAWSDCEDVADSDFQDQLHTILAMLGVVVLDGVLVLVRVKLWHQIMSRISYPMYSLQIWFLSAPMLISDSVAYVEIRMFVPGGIVFVHCIILVWIMIVLSPLRHSNFVRCPASHTIDLFSRESTWIDGSPDYVFLEKYGFMFQFYVPARIWFVWLDSFFSIAKSVVLGLRGAVATSAECSILYKILGVLSVVHGLVATFSFPFHSRRDYCATMVSQMCLLFISVSRVAQHDQVIGKDDSDNFAFFSVVTHLLMQCGVFVIDLIFTKRNTTTKKIDSEKSSSVVELQVNLCGEKSQTHSSEDM
eukprot:PhF_6_TR996/c0_g1_i1/m.1965